MEPRIEIISSKKLIGMRKQMSLADDNTVELWQTFMPRRDEVKMSVTTDYISMRVYDKGQVQHFAPTRLFEKWAAVEVSTHNSVPNGMEAYSLQCGKYAVFLHQGPAATFPKTMEYIFGSWLPTSIYELDDREHFERLPEGYSPVDPETEEEVWVPSK